MNHYHGSRLEEHYKAEMLWEMRAGVKIGICDFHYYPNDPFLFHGFIQWSLFFFRNFQFFITLTKKQAVYASI